MADETRDIEETAANYALGALSSEDAARIEADLASNPVLARLIEEWIVRFAPLAGDSKNINPPPGLLARIETALDRQAASGSENSVTIREEEGAWIAIAQGVRKKILYLDAKAVKEAYLLDFDAGAGLPEHDHHATEDCLVLSGDFWIGDLKLTAGDFHAAFANSQHAPCRSENGCRLFIKAAA